MIVSGRDGLPRNVNLRSGGLIDAYGSPVAILPWSSGDSSMLPAASAAQRMIANDVSLLPLMVFRELDDVGNSERARDSSQWQVLHQEPMPGVPAQRFWFDVAMGLVRVGNSYVLKFLDRGEVVALQFMSGRVQWDDRNGSYTWTRQDGTQVVKLPESRVLHFRGPNFDGSREGLSMIQLHKTTLDVGAAQETYQRAFYTNGSRPDLAISHPAIKTVEQGDEYIAKHEARHRGAANGHKLMILPGEATVTPISMSFEDAQFIQSKIHSVREVEQIFLMPPGMLHELARPIADPDLRQRYVRQTIAPVTSIIEGALEADPDMFGVGSKLYPEFNTAALLKADIQARYAAYLQARQAGWLSPNEIRAAENYPPVDGGDVWQVTPVGGAPNTQPQDAANNNPDDAADQRMRDFLESERLAAMGRRLELVETRDERAGGAQPIVNVNVPDINVPPIEIPPVTFNVETPQIKVPAARVTVNVPEQAPPVVNVHVPDQPAPSVTVNVPEQAAPVVNVSVPSDEPEQLSLVVDRDPATGLITTIRPG